MTIPQEPQPQQNPLLDEGTYPTLREPSSASRLTIGDGTWHQISPRYVGEQVLVNVITLAILAAVGGFLWLQLDNLLIVLPFAIIAVFVLIALIIVPRQARAYGYRLREDDIVFRRGILWQRFVAVPYGRMQLIDITHGPLDRAFGLAQLKMVTAAASTNLAIPGLPQRAAEELRDVLIEVAETRRTGL